MRQTGPNEVLKPAVVRCRSSTMQKAGCVLFPRPTVQPHHLDLMQASMLRSGTRSYLQPYAVRCRTRTYVGKFTALRETLCDRPTVLKKWLEYLMLQHKGLCC